MLIRILFFFCLLLGGQFVTAADFAITGLNVVKDLGITPVYQRNDLNVAVVKIDEAQKTQISTYMHKNGKCGGYEVVSLKNFSSQMGPYNASETQQLDALFKNMKPQGIAITQKGDLPEYQDKVADALKEVSPNRLLQDVTWISAYTTRHHSSKTRNEHVLDLKNRLETLARGKSYIKIDLIEHNRTKQNSLRATLTGKSKPSEIVGLGAHFDSINQNFFQTDAPGADDDGSGSANLIEIFRLLLQQDQPERSIEFFWYAAEEVGLYGSSEIAAQYAKDKKDVIAVMQLDMTLFPGSGKLNIGLMTDFTNSWLNSYLVELNRLYVKAKIIEDTCGYGCSDHASWYRQGFPATFPFESNFSNSNHRIHTKDDVISSRLDFEHSAAFSQLGLAYAMTLANSDHRQP